MKITILPERPGVGRLGRHVEHDPRSKAYGVVAGAKSKPKSVDHRRHCAAFNQGELGSCTGNAMAGALMTGTLFVPGRELSEEHAVLLYAHATALDDISGTFPPEDTGSSGIAVAKAAVKAGYLYAYRHAFGLDQALLALSRGPVIVGVGWYSSFDEPLGNAAELRVAPGATLRGGHEVELLGLDIEHRMVKGINSWGEEWGADGRFCWSFDTFERLLREDGDVVVPIAHPAKGTKAGEKKKHPWRNQRWGKGQ